MTQKTISNIAEAQAFAQQQDLVASMTQADVDRLAASGAGKIRHNLSELKKLFVGPIHPALDAFALGLITGHPALIVGPAGTAKSAAARAWCKTIDGKSVYKLLSPSSTPGQIFGEINMAKLKKDGIIERMHENRLPGANAAVFDEMFRASEFLLGSLFMALNEKKAENTDGSEFDLPVLQIIALCNDLPPVSKNHALLDRFVSITHLGRPNFAEKERILDNADSISASDYEGRLLLVTIPEVLALRRQLRKVVVDSKLLVRLSDLIEAERVAVSPRRLNFGRDLVRANAALNERADNPNAEDLLVLATALCITADEAITVRKIVHENIDARKAQAEAIMNGVKTRIAKVMQDTSDKKQSALEAASIIQEGAKELTELEKEAERDFPAQRDALKALSSVILSNLSQDKTQAPDPGISASPNYSQQALLNPNNPLSRKKP